MTRVQALRVLRQFEEAVREDTMRGSHHPDSREPIHQRYKVLKERTLLHLLEASYRKAQ
jgi:hypothetical protein